MTIRHSAGSRVFDILNYSFLTGFGLVCVLPFIHVIAASFATVEEVISKKFILIPTTFSLDAYRYIFSTDIVYRSLIISILVTAAGTAVSMFLSSLMAYGLSRKELMGRRVLMFLVVFTMLFSGGMIPTFLVVKSLGLLDTYWSLILPTAINAFNLIILKNFFKTYRQASRNPPKSTAAMTSASSSASFFRCLCRRLRQFRCFTPSPIGIRTCRRFCT